ncbi:MULTISPECIES: HAD family phosphatase [unclassified Roseitalea]|uniref:HAD family hydrolase n=1 Tax=unclassified Roseitalea TaxID=2639107 RepID=UPI00273F023A|nr:MULTISPECIES: HAD family phosphatase [unclassified Roseitalea]
MDNPLIIFDCDGVLIDSERIYVDVELAYLADRGITVERDWYMRQFLALATDLWRERFSGLVKSHTGADLTDAEYDAFKLMVRTRVLGEVETIEGIEALLTRLSAPRCVASSTVMSLLPRKLERTGLDRFFGEAVYSGDLVEHGKPAPDLFLHAAERMGHKTQDCITIEDSPNGVRGAKAAGQFVIGFTGGGHWADKSGAPLRAAGADHIVASHAELADWLTQNTTAMAA